jgi:TusA-related sulfurtransferase
MQDPLVPALWQPDSTLDITMFMCPMTYVHTRLALDRLRPGQVLQVRLQGQDSERQVPANAARQGHEVYCAGKDENGIATIFIRRR